MASKTIEQFVIQLGAKGIEVSENTVRRKLKLIQCSADDLQDVFTQAFVFKMMQDGFEAAVFSKMKRDSGDLKDCKHRITSLETEVQSLKERLERLENTGKVVSKPEPVVNFLGDDYEFTKHDAAVKQLQEAVENMVEVDDGLKPWERAFDSPQYESLLKRYRSIPETDDCHIVNWITSLDEVEREDFYVYAEMDWQDENHPRFR